METGSGTTLSVEIVQFFSIASSGGTARDKGKEQLAVSLIRPMSKLD